MKIADLARAFASGETTPGAIADVCFANIAADNPRLNAIVHLDEAKARAAAAASATRHAAKQALSPLDGIPVVIKANVAVAGLPWTAALGPFAARVADEDSEVVKRLRNAGAVVLGVANMHEGALGATTVSPLYGPGMHPMRNGFTPGGSSGGSAAAVAGELCAGAVGSDTMGSVRLPSAYCGVVGMKPSLGRIPRAGVELLSFSLDHVGVHASDVAGARALLTALADTTRAEDGALFPPLSARPVTLNGLDVGVLVHDVAVQPEIAARFEEAVARIARAGARIGEARLDTALGTLRRRALLVAEAECAALFAEAGVDRDDATLSETFRAMVAYGATQPAVRLAEAYAALRAARLATKALFGTFEVLLCPTTPHVAFAHAHAAPATQADLTVLADVAGLPAISIPMGDGGDGLPCGLQIMSAYGSDSTVLGVAEAVETLL